MTKKEREILNMKYYYTKNYKTNEYSKNYFKSKDTAQASIHDENTFVEELEVDCIMNNAIYNQLLKEWLGNAKNKR